MARAFVVMMVGEAAWALFEAMELVIVDLPLKQWCFALRASGAVTMILGLLATVLLYTGNDRWMEPRRFGAICAPSLALLVLAWTNPWHHLYWTKIDNERIGAILDRDAGVRRGIPAPLRVLLRPGRDRDGPAGEGGLSVERRVSGPGVDHALRSAAALGGEHHRHDASFLVSSMWIRPPWRSP